jgi:beta-glucosidase
MGTPAKCLPVGSVVLCEIFSPLLLSQSATALGATFDPELIESIAIKLLAPEARLRAVSVVLGPTCNIQRARFVLLSIMLAFTNIIYRNRILLADA